MPTFPLKLTDEELATLNRRASAITDPMTGRPMSQQKYAKAKLFDGKLPKSKKAK